SRRLREPNAGRVVIKWRLCGNRYISWKSWFAAAIHRARNFHTQPHQRYRDFDSMKTPLSFHPHVTNRSHEDMKSAIKTTRLRTTGVAAQQRESTRRLQTTLLLGFVSVVCLTCIRAPLAEAANSSPPDRMTYQGFLVDGSGNALAPTTPINYPVVFRI